MSFSRRGRPLAEEEKSTDAAKARARAMELLAGQELSSGQLYERLGRKFTQPTAAAVVAEMVERQYVDDERYARTRAHGLLAARKSRRAAAQNLRQKGLDAQQISAAGRNDSWRSPLVLSRAESSAPMFPRRAESVFL